MESYIKYAQEKGTDYIELHSVNNKQTIIDVQNRSIKDASFNSAKGFSVRVLYNGALGTSYSDRDDYKKLIDIAIKNARALSKENPGIKFNEYKAVKKRFKIKCKVNPSDVDFEDKKKKLLGYKQIPGIKVLDLIYGDNNRIYRFVNSEGSNLEFKDVTLGLVVYAYSQKGKVNESFLDTYRIHGGYENIDNADVTVRNTMRNAVETLDAKYVKGGDFPVLIDQKLAGVFAHEAVGHACEADFVLKNVSALKKELFGKKIASNNLTIADNKQKLKWGYTPFDNEGFVGGNTILIKNGMLNGYLHTKETAAVLGMEPTGNGRAMTLSNKPIPRMTNTIIENGDSNFNEMARSIKRGYYLKGSRGGETNVLNGQFLFNAQECFLIENGEVKQRMKPTSLSGNILDILPKISLIGNDSREDTGFCGKDGQYVTVSENAPHIKIDLAKVGGQV